MAMKQNTEFDGKVAKQNVQLAFLNHWNEILDVDMC